MTIKNWQPPSEINNFRLYLPIIHPDNPESISSHHEIYLDVDAQFEKLWNTQPPHIDYLFESLCQLIRYLMPLIKQEQHTVNVYQKEAAFDLVTEMDQGIEYLIRHWIKKHFPDHKIIGEEFGQDIVTPNDFYWFLDPIDGTSNYAKGTDSYCLNLVCLHQGKPFLTIVAFPAINKIYSLNIKSNENISIPEQQICSEFYSERKQEDVFFDLINKKLQRSRLKNNALGYSLTEMFLGKCDVFYKANVKLWDVMAPAALLYFQQDHYWDIELMTYSGDIISPFSNKPSFIDYLNTRHADNCRVGLFSVTAKSDQRSKHIIREIVYA